MVEKPENKPEFLCLAPWVHTFLSPQSERRLCCSSRESPQNFKQYIDTDSADNVYNPLTLKDWWNSEQVRSVRRTMMAGDIPDECQICNHKLLGSGVYRDYFSDMFSHHYDDIWEATDELGYTTMTPISWDYRFSNLCNFKCRMCGDMFSSSWETENKRYRPQKKKWWEYSDQIKRWQTDQAEKEFREAVYNKTIEEIYWAGGEPLMFEQHWEYMKAIVDLGYSKDVYVRYSTNLSRVNYKNNNLWHLLSNFKHWDIFASIDGTGEVGEYIRTGLKYDEWLSNIKAGVKVMGDNRITLDCTLTLPGLLEIKNLSRLSSELGLKLVAKVMFGFDNTTLISPMALPRDILNEIVEENLDWLQTNGSDLQENLIKTLQNIKNRPTFEEEYGMDNALVNKRYYQNLDKIRGGLTIEYILSKDKRLIQWWNSLG